MTPEKPTEDAQEALDVAAETGRGSAGKLRADGMPVGRPFVPGICTNPGGQPKDPIARVVRDLTCNGEEVVKFLLAVVRDDLDGRMADKGGVVDKLEVDAKLAEDELARARDEGDMLKIGELEKKARELRERAKLLRAKLARKRKVAVAVKTRVAAAQILLDRGWGRARETIDLKLGGDGTAIGVAASAPAPGALAALEAADLAAIGEVLERAAKRAEPVTIEVEPE